MPRRGGRKKVAHASAARPARRADEGRAEEAASPAEEEEGPPQPGKRSKDLDEKRVPRTMIVRRGATDKSVQELVRELRRVMAPHTAERLKRTTGK